jgi:hypothetical protein
MVCEGGSGAGLITAEKKREIRDGPFEREGYKIIVFGRMEWW